MCTGTADRACGSPGFSGIRQRYLAAAHGLDDSRNSDEDRRQIEGQVKDIWHRIDQNQPTEAVLVSGARAVYVRGWYRLVQMAAREQGLFPVAVDLNRLIAALNSAAWAILPTVDQLAELCADLGPLDGYVPAEADPDDPWAQPPGELPF
ncbi:MAG: hypothetical protein B7733_08490 [Myxococcales bacterium FL481]|nr:MAG: hypothetical protein B7733_08490 [Myxococcales bacterium FL481]